MTATHYHLLIIGGGITGAGIALDAASRGLKVALVEKRDFAWGTSSRSTKLIHGGLRYLKQMEFRLVREVGLERATVYRNARHIVRPERMLLPIVQGGSLGKSMTSIALWVYDWLAKVDAEERRKMLRKEETLKHEPLLRQDILKGGGLYYEYRSDDARLTIENLKTAFGYGADAVNYAEVVDFVFDDNDKIQGAKVKDALSGEQLSLNADVVVNAAGPWVDDLRRLSGGEVRGKRLHLTKGVHVVVPKERLPVRQSVYFDVDADNRMVFAIPRGGVTYIGTTDTHYQGDTGSPQCSAEDADYVLAAANAMFPKAGLTRADVLSTWSGLRPLIHEDGKDPSELSRKDEIFYADNGLISIAGGKLTGYRKMAERVTDAVIKALGHKHPGLHKMLKPCHTEGIKLGGGDFDSEEDLEAFILARTGESGQIQLGESEVRALAYKYGKGVDDIIHRAYELYPNIQDPTRRIHAAEVGYGIEHEMCHNLNDYLIRRTGRLYFERPDLARLYPIVADEMAEILGWDDVKKKKEIDNFKLEYKKVLDF